MATVNYYGLPSVQSDTTPVLGGNLNSNGKNISNALNVNAAESSNNTIGTAAKTTFLGNGASLVGLQASGAILTALNAITGSGIVVLKNDGTFVSRGITVNVPLTITNASGILANPNISINAASVVNDGYMTALDFYKLSGINAGTWVLGQDGTSDFYGAGTDDVTRGTNLLLATAFAQAGQEVSVGPGIYNVGANQIILPVGGSLRGKGPGKTFIVSSLGSSSLASIALSSRSVLSDLTIQENGGVNLVGGASADTVFSDAVVENVYIQGTHPASGTRNGITMNTSGSGSLTLRNVFIESIGEGVVVGNSNYHTLRAVNTNVNVFGSYLSRNHGYRIKNTGSGCKVEIYGGYTTASGNSSMGNIALCNEGSGNTGIYAFNHAVLASGAGNTYDTLGKVYIANTSNKTGIAVTSISGTLSYLEGALSVPRGGTGLSTIATGRIPYASATDTLSTSSNLTFGSNTLKIGNGWLNATALEGQAAFNVGAVPPYTLGIYGGNITVGDGNNIWNYIDASGKMSIGTGLPAHNKAILELSSTGSGFLLPRMTLTQRDAITTPPEGLEVYNTTTRSKNVYNGLSWDTGLLPKRASMFHEEATSVSGAAITRTVSSSQPYNMYVAQSAAASGDRFTNTFYLASGVYFFGVLFAGQGSNSIVSWYISDGSGNYPATANMNTDLYTGGSTFNQLASGTVTIFDNGWHRIMGAVNGKNASSTNWNATITKYWLKPLLSGASVD